MAVSHSLSSWTTLVLVSLVLQTCMLWNRGETAATCATNETALLSSELINIQIIRNPDVESRVGYPPENVILNSTGWCSVGLGSNIHDPYIEFNFNTTTAILSSLVIAGAADSYVTQVRLETDKFGNGDFEFVIDPQTNEPLIINTMLTSTDDSANISLNGALARVVRVRPYAWITNSSCMRIELCGSIADPDSIMPTVTDSIMPTVTTTGFEIQSLVLRIALPVSLITLLLVIVISIISISLCWYITTKEQRLRNNATSLDSNVEMDSDRTIKHVKNVLYQASGRSDLEDTTNSRTEIITTSCTGGGPPRPYETAVPRETSTESDNATYYSPVSPTHSIEVFASGYEIVGGTNTMDSHGYERVVLKQEKQGVQSKGKKEGNKDAVVETKTSSLEVSRYMNIPPSPASRGFGMSESYGPEAYQV